MSYEPRIREIERRLEQLQHENARLQGLLNETQQSLNRAWMNSPAGGGGGGAGAFWAESPGFAAATGTWPALTPDFDAADVYQDVSGSLVLVATGATIYWWYKDASTAGKLLMVLPNGDGTYDAILDSCSAI